MQEVLAANGIVIRSTIHCTPLASRDELVTWSTRINYRQDDGDLEYLRGGSRTRPPA
ncbi:hypothetical protein [Lentzea californiensis]|uniref:hypothetical protein n=1 Tax=Lentzea californiensis TaxID=438851 RepID=UPI0021664D1F|nr:hypothetical protein [Lentzea californiensis]MCR3750458.1 hypothetical protein [Lentzea californiensis]